MIHRVHEDVIFQSCGIRDFLYTENVILTRQSTFLVPNIKLADFLSSLRLFNIYVM